MNLFNFFMPYFSYISNMILSSHALKALVLSVLIIICSILLINIVLRTVKFILFVMNLLKVSKDNTKAEKLIKNKYKAGYLIKRSFLMEKVLCAKNSSLAAITGIDEAWIDRLIRKKRKIDLVRVLNYASDKGLFTCFKTVLKKIKFGKIFIYWLNKNGDLVNLQKLAMLSNGQDFDRETAFKVLRSKLPEIRELMGSFEWIVRYFAIKILLLDSDDKTSRLVWEAVKDPHFLVRKLIVNEFDPTERERFYRELYNLLTSDPVFEVRKDSWERIHSNYQEYFEVNHKKLQEKEALYILQQLRVDSKTDENFALNYLESGNLELRYAAASYLDKCGCLDRLAHEVDLGNMEALERNYEFLKKASEVNVVAYLKSVEETNNPATLFVAAKILNEKGDIFHITILAKKVFYLYRGEKDYYELYKSTLECVSRRGNERALRLLNYEINKRRDEDIITLILSFIPQRYDNIFIDTLFELLIDNQFKYEESLYQAFLKIPVYALLPIAFEIINDETDRYTKEIKIRAIKLLGKLKMHYCLQNVLENLNLMSITEANDFTKVLCEYPAGLFNKKVEDLSNSIDSRTRASIIAVLPATGNREFIKIVQKGLSDADPDVRIASITALTGFEENRAVNDLTNMLYDPVERVRIEACIILAKNGNRANLKNMEKLLNDKNENFAIKKAIITGLGHSGIADSIEMIIHALEIYDDLAETAVISLSQHTDKNEINSIIEYFKDASPKLKDRIVQAFIFMREKGESPLAEILKEENTNLNPYIAEVLEKTGYIDRQILNINNKDSGIRKSAIEILALIGTTKSYRGIVSAAFDPDNEIRIKVVKALEKLEHEDSRKILKELEKDPDKKVRKYTLWALERLKAKEI